MQFAQRFIAIVLLCLSGATRAESAADALNHRLESLTSMAGEFTQVLTDDDGTVLERSRGDFVVQKPGRFYWNTTEPFPQLLVGDGETLWLYDPDLLQVTVREMDARLQRTPAQLISESPQKLAEAYDIAQTSDSTFVLTPTEPDELFDHLTLEFAERGVAQMALEDSLGRRTVFSFSELEVNKPVDETLFHFEPPEGVDVLID